MKNLIRIVPPEPSQFGWTQAQGTRVFVGDQEISHVVKIEALAEPNSLWEVTITLQAAPPEVPMVGRFFIEQPRRWWRRWFKPRQVELTDMADLVRRFGTKGSGR